jgi:flavin reductase (DIM6/NTAB) family NADH-FMN oxidoreductase RutF
MNNHFTPTSPESLDENTFTLIGKEWMLITAGTIDHWNTMTASWGGLGVLWGKNVSFCFVRNTRYTFEFMNESPTFSLTFFDEKHRSALDYCGSNSGRDVDKAKETGLTPVEIDGSVAFTEARLVLVCRKLYEQDMDPASFVDPSIADHYVQKDYHRIYVGEIVNCLTPTR